MTQPRHSARQGARPEIEPGRRPVTYSARGVSPLVRPTTAPRSTTRRGSRQHGRGRRAGCASKTTKSAVVPSARLSSRPSQVRARHDAAPSASARRQPVGRELDDLLADQAVRQHPAGVGAGVDRDPRLVRRADHLAPGGVQPHHVVGVRRELRRGRRRRTPGKLSSCLTVGTSATPLATIASMRSADSPVPCSMQSMPEPIRSGSASSPKTCAVTRAPSACAACHRGVQRLAGPRRGQVAGLPLDPVADELDPAVAAAGLLGDVGRQLVGLDLVGVVADVALRCGRCAGRRGSAAAGRRARGSRRCPRPSRSRAAAGRRRRGR